MAADFKSHVLLRDEKGFLGLPFKRLLLAGVVGGLIYAFSRFGIPDWAIPMGIACGLFVLIMTGTRGGLPLWQRLMYRLRGSVLLMASHEPNGLLHQMATALELPLELVVLDGAQVFVSSSGDGQLDMREWIAYSRATDADSDDGLRFVTSPLGDKA